MLATNLEIYIYNSSGNLQVVTQEAFSVELARKVNDIGAFSVALPLKYKQFFTRDTIIQFWRSVNGGPATLVGETSWFAQKFEVDYSDNGQLSYIVTGFDANVLLKRRNVLYYAATSYTEKTGAADNMCKAIVRENFGSLSASPVPGVDNTRRNISNLLSVQADSSAGATVNKSFSWRQVLGVLQEIANSSYMAGSYLAFDIVATNSNLEFRTYVGQRGVDRSWASGNNVVIFDPQQGNLTNVKRAIDFTNEATFVLTGGPGEGTARIVGSAVDLQRAGMSPYGWNEFFQDARNNSNDTVGTSALTDDADAALRASRPLNTFSADVIQLENQYFGKHYGFGDIVAVQLADEAFDCRIDAFKFSYNDATGKENFEVVLQRDF